MEITLYRIQSKANGEFIYILKKKYQNTHSVIASKLKRNLGTISASWLQSSPPKVQSDNNIHSSPRTLQNLVRFCTLCTRETRMWKFVETFKLSFKSFSDPKLFPSSWISQCSVQTRKNFSLPVIRCDVCIFQLFGNFNPCVGLKSATR